MSSLPYDESRRLTGCNPYFDGTGAALETMGEVPDESALARWRESITLACDALGWPSAEVVVRRHETGASLAFTAPADQLYAATEVNEWAWSTAAALPFSPRGEGLRLRATGSRSTERLRVSAKAGARSEVPEGQ